MTEGIASRGIASAGAMSDVTLTPQDEQELVRLLAERVVETTARKELAVFDETAQEYFADPKGVLAARGRDELAGSGVEIALLTPYILAVVTPIIQVVVSMVGEAVKKERQSSVTDFVRRLIGRSGGDSPGADPAAPSALSPDQLDRVHDIALRRATAIGLPDDKAALLAGAIVGGLTVPAAG